MDFSGLDHNKMMQYDSKQHRYKPDSFIHFAIQELGGGTSVCHQPTIADDFIAVYGMIP